MVASVGSDALANDNYECALLKFIDHDIVKGIKYPFSLRLGFIITCQGL